MEAPKPLQQNRKSPEIALDRLALVPARIARAIQSPKIPIFRAIPLISNLRGV
jgi:hypothetical protein